MRVRVTLIILWNLWHAFSSDIITGDWDFAADVGDMEKVCRKHNPTQNSVNGEHVSLTQKLFYDFNYT